MEIVKSGSKITATCERCESVIKGFDYEFGLQLLVR